MKTAQQPTDETPRPSDLTRADVEESLASLGWKQGAADDAKDCWWSRDSNRSVIFDEEPKDPPPDYFPKATYSEVKSDEPGMHVDYASILAIVSGRASVALVRKLQAEKHRPALPAHVAAKLDRALGLPSGASKAQTEFALTQAAERPDEGEDDAEAD